VGDEYYNRQVTVHLYFVGVQNLEIEYPNWLMGILFHELPSFLPNVPCDGLVFDLGVCG
jgi:hypothetical protein